MFNNIHDSRAYKLFWNRYFLLFICINIIAFFLMKRTDVVTISEFIANHTIMFFVCITVHISVFMFELQASKSKMKVEKLFIVMYACMSILAVIAIPPMKVPDEFVHFVRAYEVSCGVAITPKNQQTQEIGSLLPKEILLFTGYDATKATWNRVMPIIEDASVSDNKKVLSIPTAALYAPTNYLAQAFGISAMHIFTNRLIILYYGGRLFNILLCGILLFYAIKFIPLGKWLICCLSLLPMSIQSYNSFSPDGMVIALSAFFVAYILKLRCSNRKIEKLDYIRISCLIIFLALGKVVYFPLCFLVLMLPKDIFRDNKLYYCSISLWCLSSLMLFSSWFVVASRYLVDYKPGVNSIAQIKYVIGHPFIYLYTLATTIMLKWGFYFASLFGCFGWLNISVPRILLCFLFIILILIVMAEDGEIENERFSASRKSLISVAIVVCVGIFTALYVQWTEYAAPIIEGVQGRYFLPLLPLVGIALKPRNPSILVKYNDKLLALACLVGIDFCALIIMTMYTIKHV